MQNKEVNKFVFLSVHSARHFCDDGEMCGYE